MRVKVGRGVGARQVKERFLPLDSPVTYIYQCIFLEKGGVSSPAPDKGSKKKRGSGDSKSVSSARAVSPGTPKVTVSSPRPVASSSPQLDETVDLNNSGKVCFLFKISLKNK